MEFLTIIGVIGLVVFILPIVSLIKFAKLKNEFNTLKTGLDEQISELQRIVSKLEKEKEKEKEKEQASVSQSTAAKDSDVSVAQIVAEVHAEISSEPALATTTVDTTSDDSQMFVDPVTIQPEPASLDTHSDDLRTSANVINDPWSNHGYSKKSKNNSEVDSIAPEFKRESKVQKYLALALQWIKEINVFVSTGVLVLFIGMSFLIKHAVDNDMLAIEYRLAGVLAAAIALLYWGWRLRDQKRVFAMALQGGALAIIYLDIFASYSLYNLLPSLLAFVLLALLVVLGVLLALSQNAIALAIISIAGGFAAPILTASDSNNFVGLFSYYSILNTGIFFIAWYKTWRALNMLGFVFTFSISAMWGVVSYVPEHYFTTQIFLIIFVLMYLFIGVLFALKRQHFYKDYVDSSLIFGTPLVGFSLQMAIVNSFQYGIALSALGFAALYILMAQLLWIKLGKKLKMLSEALLIIGALFLTLAVPFAVDGAYTGAIWAIEAAGILWLSIKQLQKNRRLFAALLAIISPLMVVYEYVTTQAVNSDASSNIFANSFFISVVLITISLSVISYLLQQNYEDKRALEGPLSKCFIVYAIIWLLLGFSSQIIDFNIHLETSSYLASLAVSAIVVYAFSAIRLNWQIGLLASLFFVLLLPVSILLYPQQLLVLITMNDVMIFSLFILASIVVLNVKLVGCLAHSKIIIVTGHVIVALSVFYALQLFALWLLLFGFTVFAALGNFAGNKLSKTSLNYLSMSLLPVLVYCSAYAIGVQGDLIDLSANIDVVHYPLDVLSGVLLWPLAFSCYFYLLSANRKIGSFNTQWLLYAGAALVVGLCLYLATWLFIIVAVVAALLTTLLSEKLHWPQLRVLSLALTPALIVMLVAQVLFVSDNLLLFPGFNLADLFNNQLLGLLVWIVSFATLFLTLFIYDRLDKSGGSLLQNLALLLLCFVIIWQGGWQMFGAATWLASWHLAYIATIGLVFILLISKAKGWPFSVHAQSYRGLAIPALHLLLCSVLILALSQEGSIEPLPWLAIVNPLSIAVLISLFALYIYVKPFANSNQQLYKLFSFVIAGYMFTYLNVEIMRAVHFYALLAWDIELLVTSNITQSAFAIFWSICGLAGTVYASKQQKRQLWLISAALLVIVVLKLFLVDMSASNTIERIVSFIGVGLLLVVIGYFSPLPPKQLALKDDIDQSLESNE